MFIIGSVIIESELLCETIQLAGVNHVASEMNVGVFPCIVDRIRSVLIGIDVKTNNICSRTQLNRQPVYVIAL